LVYQIPVVEHGRHYHLTIIKLQDKVINRLFDIVNHWWLVRCEDTVIDIIKLFGESYQQLDNMEVV